MALKKRDVFELRGLLRTAILDNSARPAYEKELAKKYIKLFGGKL